MILSRKIFCAALNYTVLDDASIENLASASVKSRKDFLEDFKNSLGFEIDSIAVIEKCNAIIITFTYKDDLASDFMEGRVLNTWDMYADRGITIFIKDIKFFKGIDVLRFLCESALGLNSVTLGDSQVLSQVLEGLKNSEMSPNDNSFRLIANWIQSLANEVKLKTDLFHGNTSLERLACEHIVSNLTDSNKILIFGYGKTGKLVCKILNREHNLPLLIVNRGLVDIEEEHLSESEYINLHNLSQLPDDVTHIVIAIDNNEETKEIFKNIFFDKKLEVVVDLSTPPVTENLNIINVVSVKELSILAKENIGNRKKEIPKVKNLIEKDLESIVGKLNQNLADVYISEQRNNYCKRLDKEKISLIVYRAKIQNYLRNFLESRNFIEIVTPYIVGISTDPPKVDKGDTINVEWSNGARAFLRQSNQLYKQMIVASGIDKVYEIGPFWRKEANESYRHLQESIGLDIEFSNPKSLSEVYFLACEIIKNTNDQLLNTFDLHNELVLPELSKIPVITYQQAVLLLRENGNPVKFGEDLGLVGESNLGKIIKKKYNSSIFVIKDYPDTIKKFYTKNKDNGLTETFDVILDGWELVSGAIRQTDGDLIRKSMRISSIDIQTYEFYISVVNEAVEHGGFCIGIDRLVAKILGEEMISNATPFPRTFKRLIP